MDDNQQEFNIREIKEGERKKFKFSKKHLWTGLAIFIVIVLIFVGAAFYKGWFSFSKDRVSLDAVIPTEVSSGEELEFTIKYQNNNRVSLNDVKLTIDYPEDAYSLNGDELKSETVSVETVLPKKGGTKNFRIRLAGEKGGIKTFVFKLNYQPANISSRFENSVSSKVNISSVLIGAYLTIPQKAINGEEVTYILDYINNSDQDFSDLRITLDYPTGFTFKKSEPQPLLDEGRKVERVSAWQLEELKKDARGTIRVSGILEGIEGENKTLKASIGKMENDKFLKYSQASAVTQISSSPLLVLLSLNNNSEGGNINSKDVLNYKIEFRNNTDIALSQLVLKAYFQGEMFNFRSLKLQDKGFFDSLNNIITWSAAGVPALALLPPGESGQVNFSLAVNENFPVNNFDDKNFEISVRAELETPNVPPQFSLERLKVEKILKSKINSRVVLKAKGYHNETSADINNFGPIPPVVNQLTSYTIHWQITNTSNDLNNAMVFATLPQGIEWQNIYTTRNQDTSVEYNDRTKQIIWKIDRIPAATGFLIPVYELVFQITIRPSITQVGTEPVLINDSSIEGIDSFTGETLQSSGRAITTQVPDDSTIGQDGGEVVE